MSKKFDLKFDDVDAFLAKNPHFAITKPVPNYPCIRAALRAGTVIEGVELVEAVPDEEYEANPRRRTGA